MDRKHLNEVQFARAFALFAVLAVHSSSTGVGGSGEGSIMLLIYNFFNIAGKLGTPTFIFLSSFILFYTYYPRELTTKLFVKFYQKRLLYILVPYFLFSLIYYCINIYLNGSFAGFSFLIQDFLSKLATGKAYSHLYFVFVSVQFYLLFPFLLLLFKKVRFIRKYSIVIGIVLQWTWVLLNAHYFQIQLKGSIALSYFMFYFLGAFLGVYYEQVLDWFRNWKKNFLRVSTLFAGYGFMLCFYVGMYYLIRTNQAVFSSRMIEFAWSTYALFACLVVFIAAHLVNFQHSRISRKFWYEIGTVSFGVYLIHPLFLLFLRMLLPGGDPLTFHGWQLITFLVTFFGSWGIVRLAFSYLPMSWIIFGKGGKVRAF
ncbi:acyltransferase family protein [Jeotgalibacillus proteolyticus]|uniref:acyltransferase family protein n=1 Tax=Jeotgalibacillus proteolyticus TaxID=2082395 RepID=UPI001FD72197|nr:acyltransferase [Jeotgalibacillus proteolyticus]